MTPQDCQRAIAAFHGAYAALVSAHGGLVQMLDGTMRPLPPVAVAQRAPACGVATIAASIRSPASIGAEMSHLARAVVSASVAAGSGLYFTPAEDAARHPSILSTDGPMPVRATLDGANRDAIRVEVSMLALRQHPPGPGQPRREAA